MLAERQQWDTRVVGASFDGTGYGDDGSTWGGELFAGSVRSGLVRVGCLRPYAWSAVTPPPVIPCRRLPGFLEQLDEVPDFTRAPFNFPTRYCQATTLLHAGVRVAASTSMGRLFDTIAALLGFTRPTTFEGQAAIWLEHLAADATGADVCPLPFHGCRAGLPHPAGRCHRTPAGGRAAANIARAAQVGIAHGVYGALIALAAENAVDTVVLSGGVFQNQLLLNELHSRCEGRLRVWTNHVVPPNDGGISLGQAAMAALGTRTAN